MSVGQLGHGHQRRGGRSAHRRAASLVALLGLAGTAVASVNAPLVAQAAEGDAISGTIWQDYDANGAFDSFEDGLAGIEVYAYDGVGNVAGPATTGADGTYTLPVTSDAARWRVEANPPDNAQWEQWRESPVGRAGDPANGTTVQFVDLADGTGAAGVDFSFQVPSAYVENNPLVYTPIFRYGALDDSSSADEPGASVMPYDSMSDCPTCEVPTTGQVPWRQIGATYGSSWQRASEPGGVGTIYSAAYVRRHAALGPGGIGAIYQVTPDGADWTTATASATEYVDVTDWGIDVGDASDPGAPVGDPNGLRPNVSADNPAYDWMRDAQTWSRVGRAGLGGLAFSPDQQTLFVVNLAHRSLIRIETGNPAAAPTSVTEVELDQYFPDDSDLRPYGLTANPLTNEMYLTVTNTAESTQDRSDLHGYVYRFAVDAPQDLELVLDFPLDFERGNWNPNPTTSTNFQPWSLDEADYPLGGGSIFVHNQPIVESATFLHGNLVVGVRSLTGDMVGSGGTYLSDDVTSTAVVSQVISNGGVYLATPTGDGTWVMENDGVAGGAVGAGVGTDRGPGGWGYFDTTWTYDNGSESLGSVAVIPSRDDGILTTGIHAGGDAWQVGVRRLYQEGGEHFDPRGAVVIQGGPPSNDPLVTSKGNGLGLMATLASAAPIEIGNYVWYDADNNGVQDPDEAAVEGATVNLYEVDAEGNRTLVNTTITDELGQYYFSSADEEYALQTSTDYVVGVDNPGDYVTGGPLESWYPTVPDTGTAGSVDPDRSDSDGLVEENSEGSFPYAAITTGGPGENDHSIDFGFAKVEYEFDKRTVSGPPENPDGDGTWVLEYELVAQNTGVIDGAYQLTDDLTGYGEGIEVVDAEVVSGPEGAVLNPDWDGIEDQRIITTEQPIEAQSTEANGTEHRYLVRVTVALATDADTGAATPAPEALTCTDGQSAEDATTGLFNTATMDPVNHEALTDDECGDLPLVTLDKTVTVEPHVVDPVANPGEYEISYGLTVTNETPAPTHYDLTDQLRFGTGISIVEGSVVTENTSPGDVATNPGYDGVTDAVVVADAPIGASEVHTYTVTVRYTVDLPAAGTLEPDPSACTAAGAADGADPTGLFNDATTSFNGYLADDDECRPVGEVTHEKSLVSATAIGAGQWEVVYGIEVTNRGVEAVEYDLADELHFGEGIAVASAEVTSVPDGVTAAEPAWDGAENLDVATGVTILGSDDDGYAPQEYLLTVIADVPLQLSGGGDDVDPATCGAVDDDSVDSTDRAFNNVSTVTDEAGAVAEDDACAAPPELTISKSVTDGSPVPNGDGTWTVGYQIEVTNTGGLDGVYDLSDRLRFGDEVATRSAAVTAAPQGVQVAPGWTGQGAEGAEANVVASDVTLAAGGTHTYQVEVVVALVPEDLPAEALACPEPGSGADQGLSNTAGLNHNDLTAEADACVVPPVIEIAKTIVSGPTQSGEDYSVTYQIEVTNSGGAQGVYDLTDRLRYGDGIEVDSAEVSQTPDGVTALATWTGQGGDAATENLIAADAAIGAGQVHLYQVTVIGHLEEDAFTARSLECGPDGAAGQDSGLLNVAVADHNTTALTDDACAPLTPPDQVPPLPDTGANGAPLLALGAGILTILAGALVVAVSRRRTGTAK